MKLKPRFKIGEEAFIVLNQTGIPTIHRVVIEYITLEQRITPCFIYKIKNSYLDKKVESIDLIRTFKEASAYAIKLSEEASW